MNCILFDNRNRTDLLPLTFTRPVAALRIGILTLAEKWERMLQTEVSYLTQDYLQQKFPLQVAEINLMVNGSVAPNDRLIEEVRSLTPGTALYFGETLVAACVDADSVLGFNEDSFTGIKIQTASNNVFQIRHLYDVFAKNGEAIESDFKLLTKGRTSAKPSETNRIVAPENVFIEPGASVEFAIINASTGPVYIGKDAEIMEGCLIRGPFALCEHAGLKMDAKVYGPTTLGPYCKAGGELNNVVMLGYSNKGHDGFLGNAVIGEWCNLGADTNNSNLKNTYEEVKLWNYRSERFEKTGLTFCGLIMGDHAKCGINTMFNTGTVVGVGANIFGSGFPRNFVPSFAWGGAQGFETFQLNKFYKTAEAMCARRNVAFSDLDKSIIEAVFEYTRKFRFWEKEQTV